MARFIRILTRMASERAPSVLDFAGCGLDFAGRGLVDDKTSISVLDLFVCITYK